MTPTPDTKGAQTEQLEERWWFCPDCFNGREEFFGPGHVADDEGQEYCRGTSIEVVPATGLSECRERERQLLAVVDGLINEGVGRWHEDADSRWGAGSLPQWLGLTESQYAAWVEGGAEKLAAQPPSEASERSGT